MLKWIWPALAVFWIADAYFNCGPLAAGIACAGIVAGANFAVDLSLGKWDRRG